MSGRDLYLNLLDFFGCSHVGTAMAAFLGAGAKRFVDDFFDGPCAAPAFRAATKAAVHLLRRARDIVGRGHGGADVVVAQNIT